MTYLSIVIPVYNEARNLEELNTRILEAARDLGRDFEVIYVDDGSTDDSWRILEGLHSQNQGVVRLVGFNRNYGQHMAVLAGFERVRGRVVVTLDADLQNPPEEIGRLVRKWEEGYDVVAGWREDRKDSSLRRIPSFLVNLVAS